MTEVVVYEDTPLGDYLASIESNESMVKLPPLQLNGQTKARRQEETRHWSALQQYWEKSIIHDTFSISLPTAEATAFQEEFKYLVVTSPLLSESLSVHPKKPAAEPSPPHVAHSSSGQVGAMATVAGVLAALGTEKVARASFAMTTTLTGGASLFFAYRYMRQNKARKLCTRALEQVHLLMKHNEMLDAKTHKALLTIQEIELVSRGYRLSAPLSPITRIEQNSRTRRCANLRRTMTGLLRRGFIAYEEGIIDLMDLVNKKTLSKLFDMYNIHSIASLSSAGRVDMDESQVTLEYLRKLAQLMHAKRRECMLQFLALDIMSDSVESRRSYHEKDWVLFTDVLTRLGTESETFANQVVNALDTELYRTPAAQASESVAADQRLRPFVHRLASLEQRIRTIEAKLYLCHDDIRQHHHALSKENIGTHLVQEYASIQQDMSDMVLEWELGRKELDTILTPSTTSSSKDDTLISPEISPTTQESLPSPLPSPTTIEYDTIEPLGLPLPAKASVFEADVDDKEPQLPRIQTKSRAERIEEIKAQRLQSAKEREKHEQPMKMVNELKVVLDRRAAELDLDEGPEQLMNNE